MNGHRGKKRKVAEYLGSDLEGGEGSRRRYRWKVRLECGHVVKSCAQVRCRKDARPTMGYCTLCAAQEVEAI